MVDRHSFHLENVGGQDVTTILESFGLEYYGSAPSVPPQIVVPSDAGDLSALAELLSERRGARVEIRTRRARREAAPAAARRRERAPRARRATSRRASSGGCAGSRRSSSCARRSTSSRCRCGSSASTSRPRWARTTSARWSSSRTGCRRRRTTASSRSAARRAWTTSPRWGRWSRGGSRGWRRASTADDYDESFAATPNLVVVDGGKGQLAAALAAMQAFDLPRVAVIALAKREEEVFVPGQARPVVLSRHDPGLQLLQRIRDEAHRFAVGFHRQRRESRGFSSLFDELEGVGPGAAAGAPQPLRLGRRDARRDAGGARGRPGRAGQGRAQRLRPAPQGGTGLTAGPDCSRIEIQHELDRPSAASSPRAPRAG